MTDISLDFPIQAQPDNCSCGPTCLQAIYRHYGADHSVERLIREIDQLHDGGTLAVLLGLHARNLGFRSTIYTFNLEVFDPSWFASRFQREFHRVPAATQHSPRDLIGKLTQQRAVKKSTKLRIATDAYIRFLKAGGQIQMEDLSFELIADHLRQNRPVLTGLSATFLYHCHREFGPNLDPDDIQGVPQGHFVVLTGFQQRQRLVTVSDPYRPNPHGQQLYKVPYDRLAAAIMLGILTYDANLLVIQPE